MCSSDLAAPAKIHADRPNKSLQIEWRDGHQTAYDFHALRWLCPCATCRGEGGQPGWLDSGPILTPTQTTVLMVFSALPTASSAYVLAARMGHDGPYVAALVTLSTIAAALSLPFALSLN